MTLFEQLCYETMIFKWGPSNFYNFARSAVDRSRSRSYVWNGDSHSNYSGLAYSITSGIRAGLVGFPVWSSDTGGYIRGLNDPAEDLWARWMWFSTFSPVYEIMIGTNHTPWYPPYTSDLVSVLKETANLHHDMLPYIKSYTHVAAETGLPIIRAAFLEAPFDDQTWGIGDAYFFGKELYVAPIASEDGDRTVYFPDVDAYITNTVANWNTAMNADANKGGSGRRYLEYFNKTSVYSPGQTINVTYDVHSVPVYVLEGSIVPRGDIYQGNNKWTENWIPELRIEVYPSFEVGESQFVYFDGKNTREVEICVSTRKKGGIVEVAYGDLGVGGMFVVFSKEGQRNITIEEGGGKVVLEAVVSLFD